MKRMSPDSRTLRATAMVLDMEKDLLCRFGAWNRDHVLNEIERILKDKRRNRK